MGLLQVIREHTSTNPNKWPGLVLSSSTTGLLLEVVLLPLCQLSDAS